MTLFAVDQRRRKLHLVSPVAHITPQHARRLAFSGWFRSKAPSEGSLRDNAANDGHRALESGTLVVAGGDGQVRPIDEATGLMFNF